MKIWLLFPAMFLILSGCGMTLEEAEQKKEYCAAWGFDWYIFEHPYAFDAYEIRCQD